MKYFADYLKERIYAINDNGDGVMICEYGTFPTHKDIVPWYEEENANVWEVEEMTEEEFNTYGKAWKWAAIPALNEKQKHSWRNFKENI